MNDSPDSQPANPRFSYAQPLEAEPLTEQPRAPEPWGFWATIGFSTGLISLYVVIQVVLLVGMLFAADSHDSPRTNLSAPSFKRAEELAASGTFLSLLTIAAGGLIPLCCMLFASFRRGITVREYLALRLAPPKEFFAWLGLGLLVATGIETLTWVLGREIVPEFMINAHQTVVFASLLWIGVIFGAPLSEEFLFRGFLLAGLRNSWLGAHGAVAVTAAVWASIHLQYDLFGITSIFLLGLVLGYARVFSNSLWIPIAMHALHNLFATVELELYLRYWSQQ